MIGWSKRVTLPINKTFISLIVMLNFPSSQTFNFKKLPPFVKMISLKSMIKYLIFIESMCQKLINESIKVEDVILMFGITSYEISGRLENVTSICYFNQDVLENSLRWYSHCRNALKIVGLVSLHFSQSRVYYNYIKSFWSCYYDRCSNQFYIILLCFIA